MTSYFVKQLWTSTRATLVFALYFGIIFPIAVTLIAQLVFPWQANGSLIKDSKNNVVGSQILAQQFTRPEYFHPRPSAAGAGYAGEASSGTNYGPTSKKLILGEGSFAGVKQLAEAYRTENKLPADYSVPVDAVTRSSSGLDPDISVENAQLQTNRVASARSISIDEVKRMLAAAAAGRDLGLLGEPRVNVLQLNLELDKKSAIRSLHAVTLQ